MSDIAARVQKIVVEHLGVDEDKVSFSVSPGFIATAMTEKLTDDQKTTILSQVPVGRMGAADEIGSAVLYLSSPEAAYITGATLHVNGGMAMF